MIFIDELTKLFGEKPKQFDPVPEVGDYQFKKIDKYGYVLTLNLLICEDYASLTLKHKNLSSWVYDIGINFFKEIRCTENSFIITMQNCPHIYEVKFEPHFILNISDNAGE